MTNIRIVHVSEHELQTLISAALRAELSNFNPAPKEQEQTAFLTRKQASNRLQCSLVTLGKWTKTGAVTGYRISGRVRYKSNEIENALIQMQTIKAR